MSSAASGSDTDDECLESLMVLLDDIHCEQKDISTKTARQNCVKTTRTRFFNLNENGKVNYRDATVLGERPSIIIDPKQRQSKVLKIGIYLNYDVPFVRSTTVKAPVFFNDLLKSRHRELLKDYSANENELLVTPSDLSEGVIELKKRDMDLSKKFRDVTCDSWPRFIFTVTSYGPEGFVSVSDDFEVRSKEQGNKVRAQRGFAGKKRRRRTPETEARAAKLRKIQAEIISIGNSVEAEKKKKQEFKDNLKFMREISSYSEDTKYIHEIICNTKMIE